MIPRRTLLEIPLGATACRAGVDVGGSGLDDTVTDGVKHEASGLMNIQFLHES